MERGRVLQIWLVSELNMSLIMSVNHSLHMSVFQLLILYSKSVILNSSTQVCDWFANNKGKFRSAMGKSGTMTPQEAELTSAATEVEVASLQSYTQHRLEAFLTVPASTGECLREGARSGRRPFTAKNRLSVETNGNGVETIKHTEVYCFSLKIMLYIISWC